MSKLRAIINKRRIRKRATEDQWQAFCQFRKLRRTINRAEKELEELRPIIESAMENRFYLLSPDATSYIVKTETPVSESIREAHTRITYSLEPLQ
jgi:hypothetical protein